MLVMMARLFWIRPTELDGLESVGTGDTKFPQVRRSNFMLSLEQCRKIDPRLKDMPDEAVAKIRDLLYEVGQLAFDTWTEENGSKYPFGDSEPPTAENV